MPHKDPEARKKYHREYLRKYLPAYRVRQRTQIAQRKLKYREAHREDILAYSKRYRDENREWMSEKRRLKHHNNPNIKRAYDRNWYALHPEFNKRHLAQKREHYQLHADEERAKARDYNKRNPHVAAKRNAMRRLRIEATIEGEAVMADFIKMVRSSRRIACYYCGEMTSGKKAHIDHMIPLSKGGSHRPDNLCASCPTCNLSKNARLPSEWRPPVAQQIMPI